MSVTSEPASAPGLTGAPPSRRFTGVLVLLLRVLVAVAVPLATFSILWWTFDFLRDENANRFIVVVGWPSSSGSAASSSCTGR